jgi:hypothetical protein
MSRFGHLYRLKAFALFAAFASGCGEGDLDDDDIATVQSAVTADNALTANALTANALTANALTANALTANALTANALTANALTANALRDPLARELLKYVVSCALDEDDQLAVRIDGKRYVFPGSLGLAREWGRERGECDGECQRWVSACVLARVDHAGVKRTISIRGEHRALRPADSEVRRFSDREATYYGNVFSKPQPMFMCLSPGKDSNERVCGDSMTDCPMKVVGSCDDACADEGAYRSFSDCSDKGRAGRGRTYHESITVFLPKHSM